MTAKLENYLFSGIVCAILFVQPCQGQDEKSGDSGTQNGIPYQEILQNAQKHLENAVSEYSDPQKQPRTFDKGKMSMIGIRDWTSGFFPGSLWYLYGLTGDEVWRERAEKYSVPLKDLVNYKVDHDMGFMIYCSLGNGYRFTGNEKYKDILVKGAKVLADRYNPETKLIKSWDWAADKWDYPVIIDNMMNLELLMFATQITGDSLYAKVAIDHADTTLENHYRDDHSSFHVVDYDTITGQARWKGTHQGLADISAWARGQSWGLYGYTMMYRETEDEKYLDQAKNIAGFLLDHPRLPEDKVPYWDYDDPDIPNTERDASAAAIMASALFELYDFTGDAAHKDTAIEILESLATPEYLAEPGSNHHFLLKHSVGNKPGGGEVNVPINYADYYFLEALYRYDQLKKKVK
jgi:rhamnogalacturonyl hydrolase YesR